MLQVGVCYRCGCVTGVGVLQVRVYVTGGGVRYRWGGALQMRVCYRCDYVTGGGVLQV